MLSEIKKVFLLSCVHFYFIKLSFIAQEILFPLNPLSANPAKRSNTLKQVVGNSQRIDWMCLAILGGRRLEG